MIHLKNKNLSKSFLIFLIILGFISMAAFYPAEMLADKKKIQVELFGGFSNLNPSDLNLMVEADIHNQSFFYDDYHRYLETNDEIYSWSSSTEGKLKKIKDTYPLGGRLKFYLNKSMALSLGFKYMSKKESSNYMFEYIRDTYNNGTLYIERKEFSPYILSTRGFTLLIGAHFKKELTGSIELEGYLSGGPLIAKCKYAAYWDSQWIYRVIRENQDYFMYLSDGSLEKNGKGTGFVLDGGIRVNLNVGKKIGFFIESGYAYQVVNNVSGEGREERDNVIDTWEGDWGIIEVNIVAPWGQKRYEYATNMWEQPEAQKIRDFKLDLSGFQLRVGIYYIF